MKIGEDKPLAGMQIGIFSKGGCGKSTVAVWSTKALRDHGLLDANSTNIGIAQSLGCPQTPVPLPGYFESMVFSGGSVSCPVDNPIPMKKADINLDTLPSPDCVEMGART